MAEHDDDKDFPVVPYLIVRDALAAIEFYKAAFEASVDIWMHSDGVRVAHACLNINGGLIYLADEFEAGQSKAPGSLGGTSCSVVLSVKDADFWFDRAIAAGAVITHALTDEFYGRHGQLRDPYGHLWGILGPVTTQ